MTREPSPEFLALEQMLRANNTAVINWNPQGTGLTRQTLQEKKTTKASKNLSSTGGTVYDFVDPPCGTWGELTRWVTQLREKNQSKRRSWNPRRNHFGGLMPEMNYVVTDGRDARDFRYTNGALYKENSGEEMRLNCQNCNTGWVRSVRQSAAGYANRCPSCGTTDRFSETGPHSITYGSLTFPVALASNPTCTIGFVNLYGREADRMRNSIRPGVRFQARFYGKAGWRTRAKPPNAQGVRPRGRGAYEKYNYLNMTLGSASYNQSASSSGFITIQ